MVSLLSKHGAPFAKPHLSTRSLLCFVGGELRAAEAWPCCRGGESFVTGTFGVRDPFIPIISCAWQPAGRSCVSAIPSTRGTASLLPPLSPTLTRPQVRVLSLEVLSCPCCPPRPCLRCPRRAQPRCLSPGPLLQGGHREHLAPAQLHHGAHPLAPDHVRGPDHSHVCRESTGLEVRSASRSWGLSTAVSWRSSAWRRVARDATAGKHQGLP